MIEKKRGQRTSVNYSVMEGEQIKNSTEQNDHGDEYHHTADDFVDDDNTGVLKFVTYLVDEPCQTIPPKQGSADDAQVADQHVKRMVGDNKGQLGKQSHEQDDNQGIGKSHQEGGHCVVP